MSINRSNVHKPLLALSIVLLSVGFSGLFGPQATGLGKGFGAVFFILFFICNLLKNEKTDDEIRNSALRTPGRPITARQHARPQSRECIAH